VIGLAPCRGAVASNVASRRLWGAPFEQPADANDIAEPAIDNAESAIDIAARVPH